MDEEAWKNDMPALTIIIPTYNRAERLQACLDALSRQTQPACDYEVIVVVDGSTDETVEKLAGLTTPYRLTVLYQANQGQHIARNHGVSHASGRYCLFLDDDIMAEPQLVAEHIRLHSQQANVVGIGQITISIRETDWFTQRFAQGWRAHYERLGQSGCVPSWDDCYGGNMSVARSLFLEVGGFANDIRRSHDIELGYRLERHGLSFVYLPQAVGHQDERKGSRELFADAEKAGAAWITLSERYPTLHPQLLGPFGDASAREALLREFLWWSRTPPWLLAWVGSMMPQERWAAKWYRFIHTYSYWRGVRRRIPDRDARQRMIGGIPILMYHGFAEPGGSASRFVVAIDRFAQQMAWLKRHNYNVLTLEEYVQYRRHHSLPPARSVVVTIDDGYAEIRSLAYPVLRRNDLPATVFLVSERIGGVNDWTDQDELKERRILAWDEIEEMAGKGIQFGAHTRTHAVLTQVSSEEAKEEIAGSKADLESRLQSPVTTFAYPHGEYDTSVQHLVEQANFQGACGIEAGLNTSSTPLTALRRIEIEGGFSLFSFLFLLRFGGRF